MNCPTFDTERQQLFANIGGTSTTFNRLSDEENFVYIMSMSNDNTVEPVILYINSIITKRGNF